MKNGKKLFFFALLFAAATAFAAEEPASPTGADWLKMDEDQKTSHAAEMIEALKEDGVDTTARTEAVIASIDKALMQDRAFEEESLENLVLSAVYERDAAARPVIDALLSGESGESGETGETGEAAEPVEPVETE